MTDHPHRADADALCITAHTPAAAVGVAVIAHLALFAVVLGDLFLHRTW